MKWDNNNYNTAAYVWVGRSRRGFAMARYARVLRYLPFLLVGILIFFLVNVITMYGFGSKEDTGDCEHAEREIANLERHIAELEIALRESKAIIDNIKDQQPDSIPKEGPTIFMITPTYSRWTQKADLVRLCQTLMHVNNLHWIVVEDSDEKTALVTKFLSRCSVTSTQLNIRTPQQLQLSDKEPKWKKSRGVEQRNIALAWLRENTDKGDGVVYFGDDDNTYDLELFDEMRYTKKMSVWPVGICGGLRWEGPVCENGAVKRWHTAWAKERPFPIDFAAFSLNLDLILGNPQATIDPYSKIGRVESDFLSQLVKISDVEAKANNCKKVLVWHTRTEKPKTRDEEKLIALGQPSDPEIET